ncbi:MAG TPA: nitroreductase family protein [Holophaga sp.]|jgi:FMN reductase [NAD(P)H]|nr:nitroreductase family protein [Holophaga sp.]
MSNPTLELMMNRRSVRAFTGASIPEADLETILRAAQQAPTSVNGQQISLVVIRDREKLKRIAELSGGQAHIAQADCFIAIVVDFQRPAEGVRSTGKQQVIEQYAEGILVGAVDAGIMLQALQTAAESLGYGTTAIGGIRRDPAAMIALLGLPDKTYPIVGTTLGVPTPEALSEAKPRVSLKSFAMQERYDLETVKQGVHTYEATLRTWLNAKGHREAPAYGAATAAYYCRVSRTIAATMAQQGFAFKD